MELSEMQARAAELEQQIANLPAGSTTKENRQQQGILLPLLDGEQEAAGEVYSCG